MDKEEDDESLTFKASATLLQEIEAALPKILWKQRPGQSRQVHRYVRWRSLDHVVGLIEPFQSEPQLLDARLRFLIPQLVDAYLEFLQKDIDLPFREHCLRFDEAVSQLLYTFCKVRGEKVLAGFLSNEARHLDLILSSLEKAEARGRTAAHHWQVLYILVLWLWHLMLAPFDLSTVSASTSKQPTSDLDFRLPEHCPQVVVRILARAITSLSSLTREHQAAAKLLVRLLNRPDIQRLQIQEQIIPKACDTVMQGCRDRPVQHLSVGYLRSLGGVVATCGQNSNSAYLPQIWAVATELFDLQFTDAGDSSAINRILIVKLLRNSALVSLASAQPNIVTFAEQSGVVEETIDKLLQALGDKDTQVRFAAAKAIGAVIGRLDGELAVEVIDAIVASFGRGQADTILDFSFEDPQKWHGLTLSLAHCLFKRSVSAEQLPSVVTVLIPAINFEKRAVTGNSLGTNVRDAACFAIWSLARRYATVELLRVEVPSNDSAASKASPLNIIQYLAIQLMAAACLDPTGNIRRGCSAALQEMIGRHPDEVKEGIALIQIIDYQAVGLRRRAMVDLVLKSSTLDRTYWTAFLGELQGWRGIGSPDSPSRHAAAQAIGLLCISENGPELHDMLATLTRCAALTGEHETEIRHGALLALCEIAEQKLLSEQNSRAGAGVALVNEALLGLSQGISELDYTIRAVRAEMPSAVARYCTVVHRLMELDGVQVEQPAFAEAALYLRTTISQLMTRSEEPLLLVVSALVNAVFPAGTNDSIKTTTLDVEEMMHALSVDGRRTVVHGAARLFALAALITTSTSTLSEQMMSSITDLMASTAIEWRVLALRALTLVFKSAGRESLTNVTSQPATTDAILNGLMDYTITERGDVGSLARFQALCCVHELWAGGIDWQDDDISAKIYRHVLKLSLERLDRVRLRAREALSAQNPVTFPPTSDVSTEAYFNKTLDRLTDGFMDAEEHNAIIRGLSSCGGTGSEHLLKASRAALGDLIMHASPETLTTLLTSASETLEDINEHGDDPTAMLELLAFMLEHAPRQDGFKWRTMLSRVQKSHYKSTIAQRLLAAIAVYRALGTVKEVRVEVLKKLQSMIKTNPIAHIRYSAAETLWCLTGEEELKLVDFTRTGKENAAALTALTALEYTPTR